MPTEDELREQQMRTARLQEEEILRKRRERKAVLAMLVIGLMLMLALPLILPRFIP